MDCAATATDSSQHFTSHCLKDEMHIFTGLDSHSKYNKVLPGQALETTYSPAAKKRGGNGCPQSRRTHDSTKD